MCRLNRRVLKLMLKMKPDALKLQWKLKLT